VSYNHYIFDNKTGKIINNYEGAYSHYKSVYQDQFNCDRPKFQIIRDWVSQKPKSKILDIGAGYGCFVHELHQKKYETLGIEISPSAIEQGKKMYGQDLPLIEGDISEGLSDIGKFDIIVCYGVVGWFMDKIDKCLTHIKMLLNSGGKVAISIGFSEDHRFFRDILKNEASFAIIIGRHFNVTDFIVQHLKEDNSKCDLKGKEKDLIVLADI
jgi:2-polyprenyl-3-methyl-5-hydroxy-6-metoxy-1,4-benzoquinol methylase